MIKSIPVNEMKLLNIIKIIYEVFFMSNNNVVNFKKNYLRGQVYIVFGQQYVLQSAHCIPAILPCDLTVFSILQLLDFLSFAILLHPPPLISVTGAKVDTDFF